MHALHPFQFPKASIILQMQVSHYVINCWSPIKVSDIILLSGIEQISGKYFNIKSLPISYAWSRPANKEELFNLCHASAWNVVERIFGILKHCLSHGNTNPSTHLIKFNPQLVSQIHHIKGDSDNTTSPCTFWPTLRLVCFLSLFYLLMTPRE